MSVKRSALSATLGLLLLLPAYGYSQETSQAAPLSNQDAALLIRKTFETSLFTFPAYTEDHYGLRLYRQTLDNRYAAAIWTDMARIASSLNFFAAEVKTPEQIYVYSENRLLEYAKSDNVRSKLRYTVTKHMPEYLYIGIDLLGAMARADEYGLKHSEDKELRQILRRYDFSRYATNPDMIRAWAAQLANQVYWLRQLGEQDVVADFTQAFRKLYPDSKDKSLDIQQYQYKLYGMTHIIFADSQYYQHFVNEKDHQWIYDYFRHNIDTILLKAKEDVIAEVGISFLLAGLDNDPVVTKTRAAIRKALDPEKGMIPSDKGQFDLRSGEHRNVLAIMLLDWHNVNPAPTYTRQPEIFSDLPYGLIAR